MALKYLGVGHLGQRAAAVRLFGGAHEQLEEDQASGLDVRRLGQRGELSQTEAKKKPSG